MDGISPSHQAAAYYGSSDHHRKLSQQSSRHDDEHEHEQDQWSPAEASSADEANRSQSGMSKRKRPLSVSCETCKQRKVKCDRGHPACGWCVKNQSQVSSSRPLPALEARRLLVPLEAVTARPSCTPLYPSNPYVTTYRVINEISGRCSRHIYRGPLGHRVALGLTSC